MTFRILQRLSKDPSTVCFRMLGTGPKGRSHPFRKPTQLQIRTPTQEFLVDCPAGSSLVAAEFSSAPSILLTHAHHDSVDGLFEFADQFDDRLVLYATENVFGHLQRFFSSALASRFDCREIEEGVQTDLGGLGVEAVQVSHSISHPEYETVGFKFSFGDEIVGYFPDAGEYPDELLRSIPEMSAFISDGSALEESLKTHTSIKEFLSKSDLYGDTPIFFTQIGENRHPALFESQVSKLNPNAAAGTDGLTLVFKSSETATVAESRDRSPVEYIRFTEEELREGRIRDLLLEILEDIPDVDGQLRLDRVEITNDEIWQQILDEEVTGFSWAGRPLLMKIINKDPVYVEIYEEIALRDISCVTIPQESAAEIEIVDEGSRTIRGIASLPNFSGRHLLILPTAFDKSMPEYMEKPPKGNLFFNHDLDIVAGKILEWSIETTGQSEEAQEALQSLRDLIDEPEDDLQEAELTEADVQDLMESSDAELVDIHIEVSGDTLLEANIDEESGILRDTCILASRSRNGRRYLPQALESLLPFVDGAQSYFNHVTSSERRERGGVRDIREYFGVHRSPKIRGNKVFSDFEPIPDYAGFAFAIAKQRPRGVGFSIHAKGEVVRKNGEQFVRRITGLSSIDLVSDAGTTANLFESLTGDDEMDWDKITLDDLREHRSDLVERIERKAAESRGAEIDELKESLETTSGEKEKLEEKVETLSQELATSKRTALLMEVAGELEVVEKLSKVHRVTAARLEDYEDTSGDSPKTVTVREQLVELLSPLKSRPAGSGVKGAGDESTVEDDINEANQGEKKSEIPDSEFKKAMSKRAGKKGMVLAAAD